MGYESVIGASHVQLKKLWGGWFPNKPFNDIPGGFLDKDPIGAIDCLNVVWQQGRLKKMFGYAALTSAALNSGASINSLFYSPVFDDVFGNAGAKLYNGMDNATPVDKTGAVVISSTALLSWTEWDFATDTLVIACDGINPPVKYDGTGNFAVLGGSPPTGRFVTTFQNSVWMTVGDEIYFSTLGDAEAWDTTPSTGDIYRVDAPITGMGKLNDKLVVFMEDHIAVLSGGTPDGNRNLTKDNRYINGIGCSGHFTVKNARIKNVDCLVFHANDGFYAFDGSQQIVKIGLPIAEKYIASDSSDRFNATKFISSCSVYDPRFNWYITALADGSATTNTSLMVQDTANVLTYNDTVVTPFWPQVVNVAPVCMEFTRTLTKTGDIIFGAADGKVYKFDTSIYTRNGSGYTGYFKTKVFDNITSVILQEVNLLADESGTTSINTYINTVLREGDGDVGSAIMSGGADFLDSTFIIGVSQLGGFDFVFKNAPVMNFGRFLQFKVENVTAGENTEHISNRFNITGHWG